MELTRPARPWEFVSAVGTQAGIFGNESGRIEAWIYPLKIFRDFHLRFHTEDRVLPAETLARTVIVKPESTTILYTSDTFSVRETFFVPVNEPGAIVSFEVETEFPLEIEAVFHRDFQLEWPAALGATYVNWEPQRSAFYFGEETKTFSAFLGSPTAREARTEFATNYSNDAECSFRLGLITKGKSTRTITLAASVHGRAEAETTYQHLVADHQKLLNESAEYYRNYLSRTVSVDLPDDQLQRAYDWSRVSMIQGMVTNPYLGTGLVAGYRTSGESQRPGFAWFFGRDSMWTALALDAEGDFASTRKALEFIGKYQREDGKIPHEIAQGANFVDWFKAYPYAYASADATPLYIIAMNDYVAGSGDTAFAQAKWDSIWKAYQFLLSTYDAQGFPQNFGFGHGWVEGGPLLPVKSELYQSGLGAEALLALANLARLTGKDKESQELSAAFQKQKALVNNAFWIADKKRFAFALDKDGKTVDEASVLSTVPMWFGLLDEEKAGEMIAQLSDANHQADWGMRIISGEAAKYSGGGYHYGSVVAAVHRLGERRRISLSPGARRLRKSARQRPAGARRLARPRHRSFVRRLLPGHQRRLGPGAQRHRDPLLRRGRGRLLRPGGRGGAGGPRRRRHGGRRGRLPRLRHHDARPLLPRHRHPRPAEAGHAAAAGARHPPAVRRLRLRPADGGRPDPQRRRAHRAAGRGPTSTPR